MYRRKIRKVRCLLSKLSGCLSSVDRTVVLDEVVLDDIDAK